MAFQAMGHGTAPQSPPKWNGFPRRGAIRFGAPRIRVGAPWARPCLLRHRLSLPASAQLALPAMPCTSPWRVPDDP
eukprot:scaffold163574_cov28-Tisochrysis_lutea.AAC.1